MPFNFRPTMLNVKSFEMLSSFNQLNEFTAPLCRQRSWNLYETKMKYSRPLPPTCLLDSLSPLFLEGAELVATTSNYLGIGLIIKELGIRDKEVSILDKILEPLSPSLYLPPKLSTPVSSEGDLGDDDSDSGYLSSSLHHSPDNQSPFLHPPPTNTKTLNAMVFYYMTYVLDTYPPIPGQGSFVIEAPDSLDKISPIKFSIRITSPSGTHLVPHVEKGFASATFTFQSSEPGLHRASICFSEYGLQHVDGSPLTFYLSQSVEEEPSVDDL